LSLKAYLEQLKNDSLLHGLRDQLADYFGHKRAAMRFSAGDVVGFAKDADQPGHPQALQPSGAGVYGRSGNAVKMVCVVTPTASGKTHCYNLPVLQKIIDDSDARALYIFRPRRFPPTRTRSSTSWLCFLAGR
jgi:hypothetical protein